MKDSNAISERATGSPPQAGRPSGSRRSLTNADFALAGPSDLPDPKTHAFRKDLADITLAGRVIASHYAEPLPRVMAAPAPLRSAPADDSETLARLDAGEPFEMLDNSLGWAWGYGGRDRLVGYVRSESLACA